MLKRSEVFFHKNIFYLNMAHKNFGHVFSDVFWHHQSRVLRQGTRCFKIGWFPQKERTFLFFSFSKLNVKMNAFFATNVHVKFIFQITRTTVIRSRRRVRTSPPSSTRTITIRRWRRNTGFRRVDPTRLLTTITIPYKIIDLASACFSSYPVFFYCAW